MFAQLFAALRTASLRSHKTLGIERDLAILDLAHRNDAQELEAQRIEAMLFVDMALLTAAKRKVALRFDLPKTLLATIAGFALCLNPLIAQANEGASQLASSEDSVATSPDEPTVQEQFEDWLKEMGLLGDGSDPEDGED